MSPATTSLFEDAVKLGAIARLAAEWFHAHHESDKKVGCIRWTSSQETGICMRLFLCGDVMTGRGIDQLMPRPAGPRLREPHVEDARRYIELAERKYGPIRKPVNDRYLWGIGLDVLDDMQPAARIVNLETSVTTNGHYWPNKGIHYRMGPGNIGCLTEADIDVCTLANNHVLDFGHEGLAETLHSLHDVGIKTAGAGANEREAMAPAVIKRRDGQRVLVFSVALSDSGVPSAWAAGKDRAGVGLISDCSRENANRLGGAINAVRRRSDVVVLSIHWGGNWCHEIPSQQRAFAHRLIDAAGVAIVHGHSSHHVKGIEVYRERLILYGCGDLITDYEGIGGRESFRGDLGLMYFPRLDPASGKLLSLDMQPTQLRKMRVERPTADDVIWLEETLNHHSGVFGTRVTLGADRAVRIPRWQAWAKGAKEKLDRMLAEAA